MRGNLRALAVIVVLIIAALVLTGARHHAAKPAPAAPAGVWLQGTASCAFRAADADVQVLATEQAGCAQVKTTLTEADGLAWQQEPALTAVSGNGAAEYQTCAVVSGQMQVTVEDSAAAGYGMGLCNDALHQGWQTATLAT